MTSPDLSPARFPLPFAAHFGVPLPRGIREAAATMSIEEFLAEFAPSSGPVRLRHWSCLDEGCNVGRLGPQPRNYQATLALGDAIGVCTAAASGPIAALTAMLYERGIAFETTAFHQLPADTRTATFVRGSDGVRSEWSMGWSEDPTESALCAVIACANRLLTVAAAVSATAAA